MSHNSWTAVCTAYHDFCCTVNNCLLQRTTTYGLDDSGDNRYSRKKHRTGSGEGMYTITSSFLYCVYDMSYGFLYLCSVTQHGILSFPYIS